MWAVSPSGEYSHCFSELGIEFVLIALNRKKFNAIKAFEMIQQILRILGKL